MMQQYKSQMNHQFNNQFKKMKKTNVVKFAVYLCAASIQIPIQCLYIKLLKIKTWIILRSEIEQQQQHRSIKYQNYAYQLIQYKQQQILKQTHTQMDHELTQEQYETVLKFMQTTNQQNYQSAVDLLKKFNFQLDNAVSAKLGLHDEPNHRHEHGYTNGHHEDNQESIRASKNLRIQEDVKKYLQYLKQKQNKSLIGNIYNFTKNLLVGLVSGFTEFILPEFLLRKIFRSNFYNQYQNRVLPELRDKKLSNILKNSRLQRKPIMFVVAANDTVHECLIRLLNRPEIARKINQSFIFSGSMSDDKQCCQLQGDKTPPSIIFCRKNIFEQIEVTRRVIGEAAINQLNLDRFNYILRDHQRATRKDRNVLIRYRNYIRKNYYGNRPGYYQQQQEEEQLYYPTAQYDKPTAVSQIIKKQNEEYQKVEQQSRRKESLELLQKEKQKQQQLKHMEVQEVRRVRKMSIPDEPVDGDIIRFSFRLPDGSTKTRSFNSEQNMDLLYHWVETNEEIQFQDNKKREFQLLHGFPPSSLSSRRDSKLKNIFESDQEKILIREL